MVVGLGRTLFHRLVRAFGSPEQVFARSARELMSVEGIGEKIAREIAAFEVNPAAERASPGGKIPGPAHHPEPSRIPRAA